MTTCLGKEQRACGIFSETILAWAGIADREKVAILLDGVILQTQPMNAKSNAKLDHP